MTISTTTVKNIDIPTFRYITSKVEDFATLIDGKVLISFGDSYETEDFIGLSLTVELRNGTAKVLFGKISNSITYYQKNEEVVKRKDFKHGLNSQQAGICHSFNMALREIIAVDRESVSASVNETKNPEPEVI